MKRNSLLKPSILSTRRSVSSGFITTNVVLFVGIVTLVVIVAVANASLSQITMARRAQDQVSALALADAGVDDVVDRLRDTSSAAWPGTNATWAGAKTTLFVDPTNPSSESAGQFQVVSLTKIDNRHYKARSVGILPSNAQCNIVSLIDFKLKSLGDAAIKSNGDIKITGTGNLVVDSGTLKNANAQANGNISMTSSGSSIEGSLLASGTISGNPDATQVVSVASGVPKLNFPTPAMLLDFETQAKTASKLTAAPYNMLSKIGILSLTGALYIKGNISLGSGDTLTLNGGGGVVVYVDGDISMSNGSTLNNGVNLVVHGSFKQTGGVYQISPATITTMPTTGGMVVPVVNLDPSLIVFNNDSRGGDAISLSGNGGSVQIGAVYAAFGDLKLTGGATYTGSLAAASPTAAITLNGNFVMRYPEHTNTGAQLPSDPVVTFWGESQ